MLTHLHIRDFAIVDEVELDLSTGMTALTGETGAGKSILLDALGLVLGDRADSASVRSGADRAEITARFDIEGHPDVAVWLLAQELDGDDPECLLRRVVGTDGRSRGYINGRPAPMTLMRELGEQLVDIHGQHEHQSLRRRDAQRALLDAFGEHESLLAAARDAVASWQDARHQLDQLGGSPEERQQRLEYLRYQVEELDRLALAEGELDELDAEHRRLANSGQLLEACDEALATLHDGERSVHDLLSRTASTLDGVSGYDSALAGAGELIASAVIQADEAVSALRDFRERLDLDPSRLQWLEQRLAAVHDLARKHQVQPEALAEIHERLRAELDTLAHADERASELESRVNEALAAYRSAAQDLHQARQAAAGRFGEAVTAAMQELGMEGGRFVPEVEHDPEGRPSPEGNDRVEFLVSANPGQPPGPLRRVASGGELSRISLAIQIIASDRGSIPTQIFDEVDAGIGGSTAAIVGEKLRTLGGYRQVLCVTHLPQVAAAAHGHVRVTKVPEAGTVRTHLQELSGDVRVDEIARMLGGQAITEQSRAHAREMLADAESAAAAE